MSVLLYKLVYSASTSADFVRGYHLAKRNGPLAAILHCRRLEAYPFGLSKNAALVLVDVELRRFAGFELALGQVQTAERRDVLCRSQPVQEARACEDKVAVRPTPSP